LVKNGKITDFRYNALTGILRDIDALLIHTASGFPIVMGYPVTILPVTDNELIRIRQDGDHSAGY